MSNTKGNLIPFNERTKNEQRNIATMGGIASGESRRKRKQLRDDLINLLETKDTQNRICLELIAKALDGDIKAFEVIRDTIGEKPKEQVEQKQEIKISMENDLGTWGK
jgi:hypothetical protein